MSTSETQSSARPSEDALLGLERLIVGRECNGFDRLSVSRKSHAFAELIRLGLAYGNVEEVADQNYPNVSVQRVTSQGRRLRRSLRSARSAKKDNKGVKVLWVFLAIAAALFGCMFLMWKLSGS